MKIAKRVLALSLVLVMALALVACSSGDTTTTEVKKPGGDTTQTPGGSTTKPVFVLPERPTGETAGKNFIIIQHDEVTNPFGYPLDSQTAALAMERLDEVAELYGCTFEFDQVAYNNDFASAMQQRVFAENGGDLIFAYNNSQLRKTLGTGGDDSLMVDLLTVDKIINFWDDEKWGDIIAKETMMAGGHFYGVSPALWINCTPLPFYLIAYDKNQLEEFGVQDLQEYWEQGEWNRDTMVDAISHCLDTSGATPRWGMTATLQHMTRATILSTGVQMVEINKINADGSADWSYGFDNPDVEEALFWLRSTLQSYKPYFNGGADDSTYGWNAHEAVIAGQSAMCVTRPKEVFEHVVTELDNFGLITWPAADDNVITGFYENCYSVAIPRFAQNAEWSAFLMYDLFEGLGEISDGDDVITYYRDRYFDSDLDVEFLLMKDAKLQYTYWPNGGDAWLSNMYPQITSTTSIATLLSRAKTDLVSVVEDYMLPNKVALEAYRQSGYFD